MKAVVVEIKGNKAAALTDDGRVIAITNKAYEVGQIIQRKEPRIPIARKLSIYASSAAAVMILGVGSWAYASPYTYVCVDVNPSIEYSVNRFDRVLSVDAVNDDGEEIIQKMTLKDLENQKIESALRMTVDQITKAGYFTEDTEGGIVITTASENIKKADELADSLQLAVEDELTKSEEEIVVEAYSVGMERVEEAKELGVTPGKLNLVEKLQASAVDPSSIDIEQWLNKPVKEIMKATKESKRNPDAHIQGENNSKDRTMSPTKEERNEQKPDEKLDQENSSSKDNKNRIDDNTSNMNNADISKTPSVPEKDKNNIFNTVRPEKKDDIKKDKNNNTNSKEEKSNINDQAEQKKDLKSTLKDKNVEPSESKPNPDSEKKNIEKPLDNKTILSKGDKTTKNDSLQSDHQPSPSDTNENNDLESGSEAKIDAGNKEPGNAKNHK